MIFTTFPELVVIGASNRALRGPLGRYTVGWYSPSTNLLIKPKYQTESPETEKIRNELFEIVVSRDNVGESMWYMYTGLLLTSLVQLKMTTRGCVSNPKTMEENYQKFKDAEQKAKDQKALATGTTYTITS